MQAQSRQPKKLVRIVLVGFMGAGKSTVGPLLASRIGWGFIDADRRVEEERGLTVSEIFELHGEASFRAFEADVIGELVEQRGVVLALGGGAVESPSTLSLLLSSSQTCVVFLEAPAESLLARCEQQQAQLADGGIGAVRPLLRRFQADPRGFEEKLAARLPQYRKAHLTVSTDRATAEEVAARILAEAAAAGMEFTPAIAAHGFQPKQQDQEPR